MDKKERLAREWAEAVSLPNPRPDEADVTYSNAQLRAAAEYILTNIKPPTMKEIWWNSHEHPGMVGVGEDGVEWVMLGRRQDGRIVGTTTDFQKLRVLRPEWLTPNGKRYELREAGVAQDEKSGTDQDKHSKWLRTKEDFETAPSGTIVTRVGHLPVTKYWGEWRGLFGSVMPARMADLGPWEVLRLGRGEG